MNKKTITVTITGQTATGKSTIVWALIKLLKENGVDVEMENPDYRSIDHLQKSMEHDITLEQRFLVIKDKINVLVKEYNTYGK